MSRHSDFLIPNDSLWVVSVLCQIQNHQYRLHLDLVCPARDGVVQASLMIVSASSVCHRGRLLGVEDPVKEGLNLIPAPKQTVSTDLLIRVGVSME